MHSVKQHSLYKLAVAMMWTLLAFGCWALKHFVLSYSAAVAVTWCSSLHIKYHICLEAASNVLLTFGTACCWQVWHLARHSGMICKENLSQPEQARNYYSIKQSETTFLGWLYDPKKTLRFISEMYHFYFRSKISKKACEPFLSNLCILLCIHI